LHPSFFLFCNFWSDNSEWDCTFTISFSFIYLN
jgi:hypothetical protein